jgi:transcriptional regulator with XRE-family HTH domain
MQFLEGNMNIVDKNIEYYRKRAGMTRKDLAEGICDESTLFRIEKGSQNPRLDLLVEISHKLKVPVAFLMSELPLGDLKEIEKYKNLCRKHTYYQDYQALSLTIEQFDNLLDQNSDHAEYLTNKKFITWNKAILLHVRDKNLIKAEEQLKSILDIKLRTEFDIGVCNSLGLVTLSKDGVSKAFDFFTKAYTAIEELPQLEDPTLAPRVAYNIAYCHVKNRQLNEATTLAYQIIGLLESKQLSFILGKTKHMLGKIHQMGGDYEQAKEYLLEAQFLFRLEKNEAYYIKTEEDLNEIYLLLEK